VVDPGAGREDIGTPKAQGGGMERARAQAARPGRPMLRRAGVVVILAALLVAGTVAVLHHRGRAASGGFARPGPEGMMLQTGPPLAPISGAASGATVDGVRCDASEQVDYHIHAHLAVFVDGSPRSIPYGIGVVAPAVASTPRGPFAQATRCYYWLHTHAADGVIHVESPSPRRYTLGDFFDIWRQPLTGARVGPATGRVTAYVDGARYTGDVRSLPLTEREDIQLDVGTPITPPRPVDWSRSQL
jgi:hypothetical protein